MSQILLHRGAAQLRFAGMSSPVRDFITHHYRHFNSAALVDAAKAYEAHLAKGGKMFVTWPAR